MERRELAVSKVPVGALFYYRGKTLRKSPTVAEGTYGIRLDNSHRVEFAPSTIVLVSAEVYYAAQY